ncbi:polysaccharide pyruvyl transferase family protein [Vibrio fluvialis]|nr:polysaccharide pyruvyl transferase family protein [Vibrio fluvialis]MBY7774586.1 polysaccharide pyruvyl transferase family protein [Vibrio fluvialis]MBY7778778.1 polysaccharide pyruvyl transferase family protein [Vibrio fluvialis]MBY7988196.1 polysaccharide pyruvyl transferase family protein [Vibrio fluvialis]MBY7993776.1 polysaccharide pyruvyl transferase family protein [Vibrio fluvialis]
MKIAIMTQPLHTNYGGLLQAYALQKFIRNLGHDVLTVDLPFKSKKLKFQKQLVANIIRKFFLGKNVGRVIPTTKKEKKRIAENTNRFIKENIVLTKTISSVKKLKELDEYNFDAFVVGSDQVWRPIYSPGIEEFFLSFLGDRKEVVRISYAASFGVDNVNEFSTEQIKSCSYHANKFDAISVREISAIELLSENFNCQKVDFVVDPTLLLTQSDYMALVKNDKFVTDNAGDMMVYILDKSHEKSKIINYMSKTLGLTPFTVLPDENTGVYPPVTQWLKGFMDAKFVVTDSFHGVIFSLIFNKQFIAIGNKNRGLARFKSILGVLDLDDRLIDLSEYNIDECFYGEIDFNEVNSKLSEYILFSKQYLNKALLGRIE